MELNYFPADRKALGNAIWLWSLLPLSYGFKPSLTNLLKNYLSELYVVPVEGALLQMGCP